jgi:glycosyltransferase involved in cell wall biosynthesis
MLLSTVIMTRNERRNIEDAVRSCAGLPGEILVVDHSSSDGTQELAAGLGCRVIPEELADISLARNMAIDEAKGDWILFLDADERMTPGLAGEIAAHLEGGRREAASFRRRNRAFGRVMRFGPLWPDRVIRLFPRGEVRWEGLVHERPLTSLPVARLRGSVVHHTYPDFGTYIAKQALYARLWAENARRRGRSATPLKAFTRAAFAFLKMSLLKLGLLDGPAGWCLCWYYSGAYTLGKYLLLADGGTPGGRGEAAKDAGVIEAGSPGTGGPQKATAPRKAGKGRLAPAKHEGTTDGNDEDL